MLNWLRHVGSVVHRLVVASGALVGAAYIAPADTPPDAVPSCDIADRSSQGGADPLNP